MLFFRNYVFLPIVRRTIPLYKPTFSDVRCTISDFRGTPIMTYTRQYGDVVRLDPLRWHNGHPGAHTVEWRADPPECLAWGEEKYGAKYFTALSNGTFWAEVAAEDGTKYSTQKVRLTIYKPYDDSDSRHA